MRLIASILLLLALPRACFAAREQSLDDLKAQFESARPDERPQLGIRIAQMQLRAADRLYGEGHIEQARVTVEGIVTVCEKARDAATQTNKHLKNTEIDVRKIAEKLRDIKRTVAFDDQPPLDQAIRRLEDVRTTLLKAMFANDHPKEKR